jgi:DNA-binding response OmpR family regulator
MALERALPSASAVVLIVENDALKRATKAADLRQEGFEVFEAADVAAAKAMLEAMAIDVVFSDIDLIGGAALARWIEDWKPTTQLAWILDTDSDQDAESDQLVPLH